MEVIGAVASVAQLAATAYSLSKTLYEVGDALSNASEDIKSLADDLSLFSQSLIQLQRLLELNKSAYSINVYLLTEKIIRDCTSIHNKIAKLIEKLATTTTAKSKLQWLYKEKRVKELLRRLRDMKLTLLGILSTLQLDLQLNQLNINSESAIERGKKEKQINADASDFLEWRKAQENSIAANTPPRIPTVRAFSRAYSNLDAFTQNYSVDLSGTTIDANDDDDEDAKSVTSVQTFHTARSIQLPVSAEPTPLNPGKELAWRSEMVTLAMSHFNMKERDAKVWADNLEAPQQEKAPLQPENDRIDCLEISRPTLPKRFRSFKARNQYVKDIVPPSRSGYSSSIADSVRRKTPGEGSNEIVNNGEPILVTPLLQLRESGSSKDKKNDKQSETSKTETGNRKREKSSTFDVTRVLRPRKKKNKEVEDSSLRYQRPATKPPVLFGAASNYNQDNAAQLSSSFDYVGSGYGSGWEAGPRHHHPTRLSDVLDEGETSRLCQISYAHQDVDLSLDFDYTEIDDAYGSSNPQGYSNQPSRGVGLHNTLSSESNFERLGPISETLPEQISTTSSRRHHDTVDSEDEGDSEDSDYYRQLGAGKVVHKKSNHKKAVKQRKSTADLEEDDDYYGFIDLDMALALDASGSPPVDFGFFEPSSTMIDPEKTTGEGFSRPGSAPSVPVVSDSLPFINYKRTNSAATPPVRQLVPSTSQTKQLWWRAFITLDTDTNVERRFLHKMILGSRVVCPEDNDLVFEVRTMIDKISEKLSQLESEKDMNEATATGTPWAKVRSILEIANTVEKTLSFNTAVVGWYSLCTVTLEYLEKELSLNVDSFEPLLAIAGMIARYAVMENIYHQWNGMTLVKEYEDALIQLCSKILNYCTQTMKFLRSGDGCIESSSFVQLNILMNGINEADAACRNFTVIVETESDADITDVLDEDSDEGVGDLVEDTTLPGQELVA